ncbi:hypothetical protein M501DRAFT_1053710 [Patellaria atrata CBS 101060]|uniref:Acyltransferase 3 domain-containing protein n=1 Tax=Patellaria atrata CBS 101060 TaxID=1346257 RepID=A0A9P4SIF6_9PEZI|nr:hypothetical protein M501DRAFT_1053710 [Patellaria atrata CBS 101060]
MGSEGARNVKWIDGVRGIASFSVICTHLARAFNYNLFWPSSTEEATPLILQWPILRLPWQGRIGVALFAFLTGYVCALKPLRQARSGNPAGALSSIAKSAFRRPPRLILPALIATAISWTIAQFGGFVVATRCDSDYLRDSSPKVAGRSLKDEIYRFFRVSHNTWTTGHMDYDDHQWALLPLLKGSMMVYVTLAATVYMKFKYRLVVYTLMFLHWHENNLPETETFGMQLFFGMFLCDLSDHPPVQHFITSRRWVRVILSPALLFIGLYLASFPDGRFHWVRWSADLERLGHAIFPRDVSLQKRFTGLGCHFIMSGIFLSPTLRDILSNRLFLWLGRNSFAVYLTHGTLLRVVLAWMIYGISGQPWVETKNEKGEVVPPTPLPRVGHLGFVIALSIWFPLVYTVGHMWTTYVDSWCAKITHKLERLTFEEDEKAPLLVT